ncbi:DUF4188 domain-containing protein [Streptomyces sp. S3(2020)]|uniref:monooxygenase family protein n=1 Tax=Streptomyces sp. S3(2020) TaxID=2732044 RepID=UPI00321718E5
MSDKVVPGRNTAAAEGDVVVFHIGLRINRLRAFSSWFPAFMSMPRMLRELSQEMSRLNAVHAGRCSLSC